MPNAVTPAAPAEIIPSPKMPEAVVRQHLSEAIHACWKTQYRLIRLKQMPPTEARKHWDNGPESNWFFTYSEDKVNKLLHIFQNVARILASPQLKIVCKDDFPYYGMAIPYLHYLHIKLGIAWANGSDYEKTQTLIHEASHVANRTVLDENRWYGPEKARRMARWSYRRPRRSTRSADNLGYYAMDCLIGGTAGIFAAA
ncbi:MAG: hypothetical protein JNK87_42570 [Bryobacterales bacterium]|nr:hypothetical protein [Bryobacterales bacterium]